MNEPFIIYSLPRSRTAWLAAFLTYGDWTCHHEQAIHMRSMDDVRRLFATPFTGTVETGAMQGWWLIHHYVPGIRAVVIRRPVEDAVRSMLAVDVSGVAVYDEPRLWRVMEYGDRMLEQISRVPGVLRVGFDELATCDGCARVFEYCLPYKFDIAWWDDMKDRNIQVDMKEFLRNYYKIRDNVENFKTLCYSELRTLRRNGVELRG